MASSVESIRESFDRAKKSHEVRTISFFRNVHIIFIQENETLRDRIEKILTKVKTFTTRKRQELAQSADSGYGSVDVTRRSMEIKV